jgi:hypothetical protein
MTPDLRDVGGWGGLGDSRYMRYCHAFDRVDHCVKSGFFPEAIAILDSLIGDRLSSRLGHVASEPVDYRMTTNQLCGALVGNGAAKSGAEQDAAFRHVIADIRTWAHERNEAVHATAKVFRVNTSKKDFAAILRSHRQTAIAGIRCLQAFDKLDTKDRAKARKHPASFPNAFFPKRRSAPSYVRSRAIWDAVLPTETT